MDKNMGYPHVQAPTFIHPATTVIQAPPNVGPEPTHLICPHCHANVQTRLEMETTTRTHLMAALLCIFGCWPCVCLPYCMDSCQNKTHYCPNCGAFIGTYQS